MLRRTRRSLRVLPGAMAVLALATVVPGVHRDLRTKIDAGAPTTGTRDVAYGGGRELGLGRPGVPSRRRQRRSGQRRRVGRGPAARAGGSRRSVT